MQTDPQEIPETQAELTDDETWDSMIQDFVHQNCELSAQFVETLLSPKNFQSALEDKMKSVVSLFIKSHLKKLSEYKALTDLQEDNLDKMKSEVATLHEENDQLNEMSLRLIREIKRLKKYVTESDIFVSILRGEIYKQKHQNKMLVDALKQLYEGNEELATKILTNAFSDDQESPEASLERVLTSPDRNRRQRSLAEDKLLLGLQRNCEVGTARSARKKKKNSMINLERGRLSGRVQALSAVMTPDDNRTIVNEDEEYNQSNRLDNEADNEIYSLNDEDEHESEMGNGSVVMSPHQIHLSESPKRVEDIELSKIKSLLTEEKFDITNFLFESKILKTRREQSQKLSAEQRDREIETNVVRLPRLPKWLRPHKIIIPEMRRIEVDNRVEAKSELTQREDQMEAFIDQVKNQAQINTEFPIKLLMKMSFHGFREIVFNVLGIQRLE